MWKIDKVPDSKPSVLRLSGRIQVCDLALLASLIETESDQRGVLDLTGVKLVDQDVVNFLAGLESAGIKLRNCPAYIREWIDTL